MPIIHHLIFIPMRILRIVLATLMFVACLAIFLDFTGLMHAWLGWVAQIQFVPAVLALNIVVLAILLVMTLVFGRIYCSVICPLGIFQDLFSGLRGKKRKYAFWKQTKTIRIVRYGFLGLFVVLLATGIMSIASIIEPYSAFGRMAVSILTPLYDTLNNVLANIAATHESYAVYSVDVWLRGTSSLVLAIVTFVGLAAAGILTGRGYCNTICPVGTILGLVSKFSLFKVKMDTSKCVGCGKCAAKCKAHCIDVQNKSIDHERCIACMNCLGTCKLNGITYTPSLANMCLKKSENPESHAESCDNSTKPDEENNINHENIENDKNHAEDHSAETASENENNPIENNSAENTSKPDHTMEEAQDTETQETVSSRRQFMTAAATATAGALLCPALAHAQEVEGNLAQVSRKDIHPRETLIVPPGAGSIPRFKRHCTGCQLCVRACHNKVLRISDDSRLQFMQPMLSFERGYCRPTCHDCSTVCPTGAIQPITIEQKSSLQIGRAIWNKDICLSATKGEHCRACSRACPNGAISFVVSTTPSGKKCKVPAVNSERCIGCGACEYVCPARPLAAIHVEGNMQHHEI